MDANDLFQDSPAFTAWYFPLMASLTFNTMLYATDDPPYPSTANIPKIQRTTHHVEGEKNSLFPDDDDMVQMTRISEHPRSQHTVTMEEILPSEICDQYEQDADLLDSPLFDGISGGEEAYISRLSLS